MHQNYGTAKPNPAHTYRHTNIHKLKGTVSVISSDRPLKEQCPIYNGNLATLIWLEMWKITSIF